MTSEGWILDEDYALKAKMQGAYVSDQSQPRRPVRAWFGHPDQEITEQTYPYITIDLIEISEATERVHRGDLFLHDGYKNYPPPEWWGAPDLLNEDVGLLTEMPTPVNLDYQISTWARNPRHDRQLMTQMIAGGRTALRSGWLEVDDASGPNGGTIRRMDFLGHGKRDVADENQKRLFNNIFRVRVSSEIPFYPVDLAAWGRVRSVHIDFEEPLASEGVVITE